VSDAEGGGPGQREVAYRLFAAEYDDADLSYSEGQEDRAPNYVVTPTGARVNRAFVVGVLTEVEGVSEDVLRARVVDPTGAFVLYAGQYQPDEQAFLDRAEPPTFVSVTGKARTFQPDDADRVYTSLRPERINEVDAETRDRWTVGTAERTLRRVGEIAGALLWEERGEDLETALVEEGLDEGLASGIALAIDHYGTSPAYLEAARDVALDVARLVAGEVEEVDPRPVGPDAAGEADLAALAELAETPIPEAEPTGGGSDPATASTAGTGNGPSEAVDSVGETDDTTTEASATTAPESTSPESTSPESTTDTAAESADVGDFEPGEFELDEAEREEIEAEYGTEFQSGTEVDEPGEAGIETPESSADTAGMTDEPAAASVDQSGSTAVEESTSAAVDDGEEMDASQSVEETAEATETAAAEETKDAAEAEDVDIEGATVAVMEELDDGSGADRGTVVETVAERHGVDPGDVEEAIQDALMDGRCYEPDDATLKPI
jgi:RPA family protein